MPVLLLLLHVVRVVQLRVERGLVVVLLVQLLLLQRVLLLLVVLLVVLLLRVPLVRVAAVVAVLADRVVGLDVGAAVADHVLVVGTSGLLLGVVFAHLDLLLGRTAHTRDLGGWGGRVGKQTG